MNDACDECAGAATLGCPCGNAPVPSPRTGMDEASDVLRKISDELSMACDYLTDRGADQDNDLCLVRSHIEEAMIRIETFAAEVRRLRAECATADTEANGYPLTEARLEIDRLRAALNEATRQRDLEHKRFIDAERNEAQTAAALASERAKRKCRGNECESFDCENCDDARPAPDATALREAAKPIADAWEHGRFYIDDSGEREAITLLGISSKQVGGLYRALLAIPPRDAPGEPEGL